MPIGHSRKSRRSSLRLPDAANKEPRRRSQLRLAQTELESPRGLETSKDRIEPLAANLDKVPTYNVHVAMNVTSINAISTVEHSFCADFFLILHWQEPEKNLRIIRQVERLADDFGTGELLCYWSDSYAFKPTVEFVNSQNTQLVETEERRQFPRLDVMFPGKHSSCFYKLVVICLIIAITRLCEADSTLCVRFSYFI